jgi:hypothetical protein
MDLPDLNAMLNQSTCMVMISPTVITNLKDCKALFKMFLNVLTNYLLMAMNRDSDRN